MTMIKAVQPTRGELGVKHLVERLENEEKRKSDIVVPMNKIRVNNNFKFESDETGEFSFTEKGFKHLCQNISKSMNLPYEYLMALHDMDKEQFSHLMNFHLSHATDMERKLRAVKDGDELTVRGIVSPTFTAFDNLQALEVFMDGMKSQGIDDYQIKTSNINEDYMMLRFILPSTMKVLGKTIDGKDDKNYVSMDLVNGETGNSPLKLLSSVYRLVCTNGMVALDKIDSLTKRHVGEEIDFNSGMRKAIIRGFEIGDKNLKELELTKRLLVDNPYEVITKYAKIAKLSETQAKKVRENYDIEAEKNVMSIINAFTRTARDLNNFEKRIQLETFASTIMQKELKRLA